MGDFVWAVLYGRFLVVDCMGGFRWAVFGGRFLVGEVIAPQRLPEGALKDIHKDALKHALKICPKDNIPPKYPLRFLLNRRFIGHSQLLFGIFSCKKSRALSSEFIKAQEIEVCDLILSLLSAIVPRFYAAQCVGFSVCFSQS